MGFAVSGIPETLLNAAVRKSRNPHRWRAQMANGQTVDWDVHPGCQMGTTDLEKWCTQLVRTGGGYPLRLTVLQVEPTEKVTAQGTIWRIGPDWEDEEDDEPPRHLSSLVPIDDGFDVGEAREDAESPIEKLILLCMEKPQIIGSIAAGAVELASPAIDTAVAPVIETIRQVVRKECADSRAGTVRDIRGVLEEMLEFEDEQGHELEQAADDPVDKFETLDETPDEDGAEDEAAVMLRRLEESETEGTGELVEGEPEPRDIEAEMEACWLERQRLLKQEQEHELSVEA